MEECVDKILELLSSFLGQSNGSSGDWHSFNCPCCAMNNDGIPDNKYNLEINVSPLSSGGGGFHCWKCGESDGTKGRLFKFIKQYVPKDVSEEIRHIVSDFRNSRKYDLSDDTIDGFSVETTLELSLPNGYCQINKEDIKSRDAYNYLIGRGINDSLIKKYKIGYIGNVSNKPSYKNRVYIPSFNVFGELTYWVGRDFTGMNKQKMVNSKVPKKEIVFNEGLVNCYEPITIVEGPFDHIATPNSIPLLGKTLTNDSEVFRFLCERSKNLVLLFLDDDAISDVYKIYKLLYTTNLRDRLRVVIPPKGYDPSLFYQEFGAKEMVKLLCSAEKINEFELFGC